MNPLLSAEYISDKATDVFISNTGIESAAELVRSGMHLLECTLIYVFLDLIRDQTP